MTDHLDLLARKTGDKSKFRADDAADWLDRDHRQNQTTLGDVGMVAALHYKNTGRRYCETCKTYKPKNRRPVVKGWQCNDCKGKT